eukprot:scaffold48446_cov68-Phaeocystis_antarctica.AAC.5
MATELTVPKGCTRPISTSAGPISVSVAAAASPMWLMCACSSHGYCTRYMTTCENLPPTTSRISSLLLPLPKPVGARLRLRIGDSDMRLMRRGRQGRRGARRGEALGEGVAVERGRRGSGRHRAAAGHTAAVAEGGGRRHAVHGVASAKLVRLLGSLRRHVKEVQLASKRAHDELRPPTVRYEDYRRDGGGGLKARDLLAARPLPHLCDFVGAPRGV